MQTSDRREEEGKELGITRISALENLQEISKRLGILWAELETFIASQERLRFKILEQVEEELNKFTQGFAYVPPTETADD